jgi:UDP:flavonoid glycosyltransferase YjiC (YdhE family)
LLEGLAQLPLPVILSSAGRFQREGPDNIYLEQWLPGETLAKHALLVVSNGGSTTSYQSLAQGTPVLGIASNLDQYLCMQSLEKLGVARHLRGASFTSVEVTKAASMMAYDRGFDSRAQAIGKAMVTYDYRERFRSFLRHVFLESRAFAR